MGTERVWFGQPCKIYRPMHSCAFPVTFPIICNRGCFTSEAKNMQAVFECICSKVLGNETKTFPFDWSFWGILLLEPGGRSAFLKCVKHCRQYSFYGVNPALLHNSPTSADSLSIWTVKAKCQNKNRSYHKSGAMHCMLYYSPTCTPALRKHKWDTLSLYSHSPLSPLTSGLNPTSCILARNTPKEVPPNQFKIGTSPREHHLRPEKLFHFLIHSSRTDAADGQPRRDAAAEIGTQMDWDACSRGASCHTTALIHISMDALQGFLLTAHSSADTGGRGLSTRGLLHS